MKIGRMSSSITAGEREKIGYLPPGANCYLEIPDLDTEPGTGVEGEMYHNLTDDKFYLYKDTAWVEVLFSMEEVIP